MWRLLRTEITYNRALLAVLFVFDILFLAVFALFGGEEIVKSQPGVMGLMWALSVIFSVFYMMDLARTRRNRLLMAVPLPPAAISRARILIFLVFWGFLSAGFWAVHLIFHSALFEWETLNAFLSLTGSVVFIHACYLLARDVKYTLTNRRVFRLAVGELISALIPLALMIVFVMVFVVKGAFTEKIGEAGSRLFSSLQGGVLFLALGLAAAALDAAVFSRRRLYVE
jgi:hypothetical protein